MKILVIPDLHGKDCWKNAVNNLEFDKVVFLGDYVDSWSVEDVPTVENLADIIQYKKSNPDNVTLILGNHDIQYMFFPEYRCSGFRASYAHQLSQIFRDNKQLFLNAYEVNNYLFTHAGISKKWYKKYEKRFKSFGEQFGFKTISDIINGIGQTSEAWMLYEVGEDRGGLRGDNGGLNWADMNETMEGIIPGFHQVVGHTPQRHGKFNTFTKFMGTEYKDRSITYCDTLDKNPDEFKIIEIK